MKIFLFLLLSTFQGISNRVHRDPLAGNPHLEFYVKCNVKQNWFVRVYYIDPEDINNRHLEKFNVKDSNLIHFIRRFDIKPPNLEIIHSCSSDAEKPVLKVESFEYTRNITLDNKGLIEPKSNLNLELVRFSFLLTCSLKFNWNLTILYFYNDDSISTSYNETRKIKMSNSAVFVQNIEKPSQIQYIHDCTSIPDQIKLFDGGNKPAQFFELADKGSYQSNIQVSSDELRLFLYCGAKLDWGVEIIYSTSDDISNNYHDEIDVVDNHSYLLTRKFEKKPTHVGFLHNCSSDPIKIYRRIVKAEYSEFIDLTNRGKAFKN
ncbi:unnamed protein product [Caenorhabditis angaria]|uniref:Uncharacterized protein n=1 Tax=Caenorhabditis angaria TaxID=860376 RepID=A0A9P1IG39_9PELO|nr:unnamed protein product [Caenorhabditis angaria]